MLRQPEIAVNHHLEPDTVSISPQHWIEYETAHDCHAQIDRVTAIWMVAEKMVGLVKAIENSTIMFYTFLYNCLGKMDNVD